MLVCRTCLAKKDLVPLFGESNTVKFDSFQLYIATGTQIKPNDGLPQAACKSCLKTIRTITNFREICEKTQEILQRLTWKIKKENNTTRSIYQDIINGNEHENSNWIGFKNSDPLTKDKTDTNVENPKQKHKTSKEIIPINKCKIENIATPEKNNTENNIESCKQEVVLEDLESLESGSIKSLDFDSDKVRRKKNTVWITVDNISRNTMLRSRSKNTTIQNGLYRKKMKEKNQMYMELAINPQSKGMLECRKCHRRLKDRGSFLYHAKTHFEPEFSCEVCGKKFRSRNHMGYHQQRRHGRIKRLACSQCGYRAVDKTTLLNHVRLEHTGERPFICAECGDSFRMRRGIVQHMKKHFGIKNLQCDRCPDMFKSGSALWSHQNRVHLMTYTYPCYLCTETYKCGTVVKKHIFKVHGVPFDQQMKVKCVKIKKC